MLSLRSLLDVLFILLLSTLVLLAHAAPIGAVDTELVRVGRGGLSPFRGDDVRFLLLRDGDLVLDGTPTTREALLDELVDGDVVLLIAAGREVRHHDVMDLWSDLRFEGVRVQLGAAPDDDAAEQGDG